MSVKDSTVKIEMASEDPITDAYSIKTESGKHYTLSGIGHKLILRDGNREVGAIVRASRASGSVWRNGQCVGEYSRINCEYRVVPIENGFLLPDEALFIHPVAFLVKL